MKEWKAFFTTSTMVWIAIGVGVIALLFAFYLSARVKKEQVNNAKMEEIAGAIHEGAMAFLAREYKVLVIVIFDLGRIACRCRFATGNGAETLNL